MTLREKQSKFARMLGELLLWAFQNGYEITIGEVHRPRWVAVEYKKQGKGILNSLHILKLAADLFLFKDGKFLQDWQDYEPLGQVWESMGGSWGGRFQNRDAVHFSLEHGGVK